MTVRGMAGDFVYGGVLVYGVLGLRRSGMADRREVEAWKMEGTWHDG